MIKLKMELVPYGRSDLPRANILVAEMWTAGKKHHYSIYSAAGDELAWGSVPKTRSGHRNPLHLLRDILNHIDLDTLGKNYVKTDYDNNDID